jgi:hypothetical protein
MMARFSGVGGHGLAVSGMHRAGGPSLGPSDACNFALGYPNDTLGHPNADEAWT